MLMTKAMEMWSGLVTMILIQQGTCATIVNFVDVEKWTTCSIHVGVYSMSPCNSFKVVSHGVHACACPGDDLIYQCSNSAFATLWIGSALKCCWNNR